MSDEKKRFYVFRENHIGFGIRWRSWDYQLDISLSLPFFTVVIGIGQPVD
jgi:hypothetical protein